MDQLSPLQPLQSSEPTTSQSPEPSKHFSTQPLNTINKPTENVSHESVHSPEQMQNITEKELIVGKLKENLHQISCSLQSLSTLLMKEGVQLAKARMTMFVKKGEECMQQISHVISKSKAYMPQTTSTR